MARALASVAARLAPPACACRLPLPAPARCAPPQRNRFSSSGLDAIAVPRPNTPRQISSTSDSAHNPTTGPTWLRSSPWRSTSAFCAPMAMIRLAPVSQPWVRAVSADSVMGGGLSAAPPQIRRRIHISRRTLNVLMKDLDAAGLDCLAALADERSFERAAQRLAITQSAVSQRLRSLEAQVGQLLVVRSRPLRLTEPGKVLLRFARQLQAMRTDGARELGARGAPHRKS